MTQKMTHSTQQSVVPYERVFLPPGRTPVPAAMRPLGVLPRPPPAGVAGLPAAAGLRVAAVASVPSGPGLLRGAAPEAGG